MAPAARVARTILSHHARPSPLCQNFSRNSQSSIASRCFISRTSPLTRPRHDATCSNPVAFSLKQTRSPTLYQSFSQSASLFHGHIDPPKPGEERRVTFVDKDGSSHTFEVSDGDNLLDIAQANDIEMEGACGGSCACSTCHVIVEDPKMYDKMEEPDDDENDMLDLAFGLTETSRLGCQIKMSKEMDGLVVKLPSMTRNLQASDFAKK
ncbi:adrenodoxin-like protein [Elsinoe australis]|uniref:Adrenodoxin-like protein n=1 Tax=Elsinoe australis TaxID=40998 RepID=A0A4U7B610_9PEZI|nr:adrenodoxin-like protein [Elsinoe australis]